MIEFEKFTLKNGLRVLVHRDESTPIAAVNLLYNVGAKDETEDKTGFAHLFEHLMFGGSINIENYDEPLQMASGENNAFTNNDITNYYLTLPAMNLETGFWLESDRMLSLAFSEKSLDVQRNVVIEEFKQRYLNQPYGDVWLLLRPLAYKTHPYKWPTIGKDIKHIEDATLEDVKKFFFKHYIPNNAILTVAGNVAVDEVKHLAEKWFGPIKEGNSVSRNLPTELPQTQRRMLTVERDVPGNSIYMVFHGVSRLDKDYYAMDMITDVLSAGRSSRLYSTLIKKQNLFTEINAYQTGQVEANLVVVEGKIAPGVAMEKAEQAIWQELKKISDSLIEVEEYEKIINKIESSHEFQDMSVLNKAMNLAFFELLYDDASQLNNEVAKYKSVDKAAIKNVAGRIFTEKNNCTLYYLSKNGRS